MISKLCSLVTKGAVTLDAAAFFYALFPLCVKHKTDSMENISRKKSCTVCLNI